MSVYSPMLGTVWRVLEAHGYDPAKIIESAYYRPGRWPSMKDRVSFKGYDTITTRAATLIKDPTLGLQSAQYLHPSHLGAMGGAWLASSSLRTALRRAERFSRSYHEQIDLRIEEMADQVRAVYRMRNQPTRPGIIGDANLAGLYKLCSVNLGKQFTPCEVTLMRPQPKDPSPWHQFFCVTVKFGQAQNSMSISSEDADTPLTGSNPELVAVHEDLMNRYLAKMDRDNIIYRARLAITEQLPSGRITESELAQSLNMSKRTLHRKLRESGKTFRSLLNEVRTELAKRYVHSHDYSVTEIAFLLGYADTSAFSRAFRNWFGESPTDTRDRARAA